MIKAPIPLATSRSGMPIPSPTPTPTAAECESPLEEAPPVDVALAVDPVVIEDCVDEVTVDEAGEGMGVVTGESEVVLELVEVVEIVVVAKVMVVG